MFVVYISTLVPKHVYFAVFSRIGSRPHYGMAALRSKNMQINLGSKRFSYLNGSKTILAAKSTSKPTHPIT